ncbi:trypsin [Drosophila grimshawi]|uniref:trypsin n=1 Tax=Drosophila grimshawi TaxID=7222 RepID=B4JVV0_DROGR|nr:trypsin [Drosophila grimshawi]EDV98088.1 GH22870 [Drosophila grimshawi]
MSSSSYLGIIVLGLLSLVAHSSGAAINGRIAGGEEADIASYPYQVSVRLETYMLLHICGGSLYAPRVVVTAAHCIKGRYASYIRIVAGQNSIADLDEQGVKVTKLIPHSGYNKKTHVNDVGMIITVAPLIYSDLVQPIALAVDMPRAGTHAMVSGWGKRTEQDEALPAMLRAVEVEIMDTNTCGAQYMTKDYTITEEMLCAGFLEGGKDACQGDSGGPLTVDGVLVGIVSWGVGCAREGFPGVYTSVLHHSEWIEEKAEPYL